MAINDLPDLRIFLAAPRGFCAGVERAILIVERAIEKYGAPVYVRHEIVHNRHVVEGLRKKGAIFVQEIDEAPDDRPIIFSAHGVPKSVPKNASKRNMIFFDATCPLVSKVHREAEHHVKKGAHIILIGHQGHPEVIGTMGQVEEGTITLVQDLADVEKLQFSDAQNLAYVSQTTLSVDDTKEIIKALQKKFPHIQNPKKEDICYATTNRQLAVKAAAAAADLLLIVGAPNSSNSLRLKDVGLKVGCKKSYLIQTADDIQWHWFDGVKNMALSAGASAPEILVQQVIDECEKRFNISVEMIKQAEENLSFKLPRGLVA